MTEPVFAIYDSKAKFFQPPFCAKTKGMVIRTFTDITNDEKHPINKHPEDYTLFEIASFDNLTGVYSPLKVHVSLGKAIEFLNVQG